MNGWLAIYLAIGLIMAASMAWTAHKLTPKIIVLGLILSGLFWPIILVVAWVNRNETIN